jgi:hypothetical protein
MPAIKLDPAFFSHDAQAGGFFPATHINPGFDIDAFISGNGKNLLIEGIRGTGKTHILKMIYSRCIDTYLEKKILPVYISLAKISEWQGSDIRSFRIQLYANIVTETISTIESNTLKMEFLSDIEKYVAEIKKLFGINSKEGISDILKKIKGISDTLLLELTSYPEKILEKKGSDIDKDLKVGAKIPQGISLDLDQRSRSHEEQEVQFICKNLAYENAARFIIEFFKQLKHLLGCRYVVLFMDECSETSDEAQLEIFRLLKLIRGSLTSNMQENYVYFCASVYPPYATKYPSITQGNTFNFEPGQDASVEYLQLDELSDEYENFFLELTRKRLELFFNRKIVNPIHELFENENAYILAAYAANGIPRRYLEILKQAYDNLCQRAGTSGGIKRLSQKHIEDAMQIVASNQILSQNKLTSTDFKIIEEISKKIGWRNKKNETECKKDIKYVPANVYFTINRSQFDRFNNLLLQGCVHDKGRARLRKYYRQEGSQGPLLMLDLTLSLHYGAIDRRRVIEIFKSDLKANAKSGYLYCQDFNLDKFEYNKNI